jgi:NDP-sugar pyrophosphorylase family protein
MESHEQLAGIPLACIEILGQSMLARTLERLRAAGATPITVVAEEGLCRLLSELHDHGVEVCHAKPGDDLWVVAGQKVRQHLANGVRTVLVQRIGAYVELNLADIVQFHEDRGRSLCRAHDREGALDLWVVGPNLADASDPQFAGPPNWGDFPAHAYVGCEYVNRLRNAREMRRLAVDCLHSRCSIRPSGREVKPGVWLDDHAHVHRKARVVAPAYIGRRTRVQATALITRSSSLERNCEVSGGTVVEDACVLSNTYLGRWLDVSHAVVDGSKFVDLRSDVAVEISDGALVSRAGSSEPRICRDDTEHANFVKRLSGRMRRAFLH